MIGIFATTDVENYGDVLYPVILKKMLASHDIDEDVTIFGFIEGEAPLDAGYYIEDFNRYFKNQQQFNVLHLLIGGGDIIRTDSIVLASHYVKFSKTLHNANRFNRLLKFFHRNKWLSRRFKRNYMGYSDVGPFILNKAMFSGLKTLSYCSCGVPFKFKHDEKSSVRAFLDTASFIWVRDVQSQHKLNGIGLSEINTCPDLIVCLSDFFDKEHEKSKGQKLLQDNNIDTNKKIISFQCYPQRANETVILEQLVSLKQRTDCEIVLIPIGLCHGDDVFLEQLALKSNDTLKYLNTKSIYEIISIIAASNLFIGTSMHGNITAFSYGIPHLFGTIAVDKAEGFLDIVGLSEKLKLKDWSELNDKFDELKLLPNDHFVKLADTAKAKVREVFSRYVSVIT